MGGGGAVDVIGGEVVALGALKNGGVFDVGDNAADGGGEGFAFDSVNEGLGVGAVSGTEDGDGRHLNSL